jgi:hypothetical protein
MTKGAPALCHLLFVICHPEWVAVSEAAGAGTGAAPGETPHKSENDK